MINVDIVKEIVDFASINCIWGIISIILTGITGGFFAALFAKCFSDIKDEKKNKESLVKTIQSEIVKSFENLSKLYDIHENIFLEDLKEKEFLKELNLYSLELKSENNCNDIFINASDLKIPFNKFFKEDDFNYLICFSDTNRQIRLINSHLSLTKFNKKKITDVRDLSKQIIYYEISLINHYIEILKALDVDNTNYYLSIDLYKGCQDIYGYMLANRVSQGTNK